MDIIERIAKELELDEKLVSRIALSADRQYRAIEIGGQKKKKRMVYQPSTELRIIQRWCTDHLFTRLPVHESCFSYVKNKNIAMHARAHIRGKYLARVDIRQFFPSLNRKAVLDLLNEFRTPLGLESQKDAWFISLIVTREGNLVIGAPSSPILSNALLFDFDRKWSGKCSELKVTYTRYADDIYLSTEQRDILSPLLVALKEDLITMPRFKFQINQEKDIFTSRKRRRRITGVTLTSDERISIGREKKRELKAKIHKALSNGAGIEDVQSLLGMLAHIDSVEPTFAEALRKKYGETYRKQLANLIRDY